MNVPRRKLPAPPLVLQPVFARVRQGSPQAARLLELTVFLLARGMLTDGGVLNLESGLLGRGGVLSLTTQDVRSWAHGLVLELWETEDATDWPAMTESYSRRFDRGKPRRPTRLQRLFQEWSADFGPVGFLEACRSHPRLWSTLEDALSSPIDNGPEQRLLELALAVHQSGDWEAFHRSYRSHPKLRPSLLRALPLLDSPSLEERLAWLTAEVQERPELSGEILQACRTRESVGFSLPDELVQACLDLLRRYPGQVDPKWLGSLRGYRWPPGTALEFDLAIEPNDPIRRIVFGPRPGTFWLEELIARQS